MAVADEVDGFYLGHCTATVTVRGPDEVASRGPHPRPISDPKQFTRGTFASNFKEANR
jgi:hypothetical protein